MKVIIEIKLGDAAMRTGRDVATALGQVQHRIEDNLTPLWPMDGTIRDANGNTVGRWAVVEDD